MTTPGQQLHAAAVQQALLSALRMLFATGVLLLLGAPWASWTTVMQYAGLYTSPNPPCHGLQGSPNPTGDTTSNGGFIELCAGHQLSDQELWSLREDARDMFYHAYDSYMSYG